MWLTSLAQLSPTSNGCTKKYNDFKKIPMIISNINTTMDNCDEMNSMTFVVAIPKINIHNKIIVVERMTKYLYH